MAASPAAAGFGPIVQHHSLSLAMAWSAVATLGVVALGFKLPISNRSESELEPFGAFCAPVIAVDLKPRSGPILVTTEYTILEGDLDQFMEIMQKRRHAQSRVGARQWTLTRDVQQPTRGVESFRDAWAFSWKALSHLADDGLIAFLLPARGFLHNHAQNTVDARDAFFRKSQVRRIINFADLRFQLFEKAHRPAALIIYGSAKADGFPYRFDYWAPKADLNLRIKRVITLSSADKAVLGVGAVLDNPLIFKQRLWMRDPDAKLFCYLARLPKLDCNPRGGLEPA